MLARLTPILFFTFALSQPPLGPVEAKSNTVARQQSRNSVSQRNGVWVWKRSKGGNSLEMTIRGEVEFNDDSTEVKSLSVGLPEALLREEAVRQAYQEAIGSVRSDHYQAETLSTHLKSRLLTKDVALSVCSGAGLISSDFYKAQVLRRVSANSLTDGAVRSAFVAAVVTIGSDFYRTEALAGLVSKGALSKEVLFAAAKATAGMSSDHYKAEMLLKLAGANSGNEAARATLVEAARAIKSDQERGRALSAIFR